MRQLIILVFQYLFIAIMDMIDTGFGNNINIDSIIVLSSYAIITWIAYAIRHTGFYGWRITRKNERSTLVIGLVTSLFLTIVIYSLSDVIPHVYNLTDSQYILFGKCAKIYALTQIPDCIMEYYSEWIVFSENNRMMFITNLIYYILMIICDILAVNVKGSLEWLLIGTLFSTCIYDILCIIIYRLPKYLDDYKLSIYKSLIQHGINITYDRLTGKVATIVFNIYASKLGSKLYSIHCVCYGICVFGEVFSNTLHTYTMMKLPNITGKDRYETCKQYLKKYVWVLWLMLLLSDFILLLIVHGDVPLKNCWWVGIYLLDTVPLMFYEVYKGFLSVEKRTDILKWCGTVGIFTRIPVTLIGYYLGLGLWPFAIGCIVDFGGRAIFLYLNAVKVNKQLYSKIYTKNNTRLIGSLIK